MIRVDKGLCYMCQITNWNNKKNKEQMIVIHNNGNKYCKFHYKIIKEYERETKGLSKEEILQNLIREGNKIKNMINLNKI